MTKYEEIISKIEEKHLPFSINILRTGYFMLYRSNGGLFSNLIESHQKDMGYPKELAKFIHVDVLGPQNYAIRVMPPKAKVVDICETYKGSFAVMLSYDAYNYEQNRDKVAWWAVSNNNKHYDWLGVAKFKLPFLFHKKNLPFCSENAIEALKKQYPVDVKISKPYLIPPAGLFDFCKVEWAGVIR